MSEDSTAASGEGDATSKRNKIPLVVGFALALVLGGAGFYAAYSGMLPNVGNAAPSLAADEASPGHGGDKVAYVPIDPILVSLPRSESPRHLRFRAQIETVPDHQEGVAEIMPRILDVLNSYLRAVSTEDLERPTALIRLRAQMLRRIQLVAGDRIVRDLLVTEVGLT